MNELLTLTAAELGERIAARQISSEEVTQAHLDRISEVDGDIHAFLLVDHAGALDAARRIDARIADGEHLGPLAGVPLAVKDLFCTKGIATTASSQMLEGWIPPYDSTIVTRCKDAGMVILGKTNLDEFAMGSSTETSAFGPTHNPWDLERVPGGSGGGSAASLASFQAPLALGTDTGGSIRQPGAVTGTVGIKPTYGSTSRYGVIAMASSLDTPGPCARTVLDAALLHQAIAGHDAMDQTTINQPTPAVVEAARQTDVSGVRIGVVTELSGQGYDPQVEARFHEAVEMLIEAGAEVVEVSCPNFDLALPAYYLIQPAEVSSNLARYDAMRYGLRVNDDGEHSAEQVMRAPAVLDLGPRPSVASSWVPMPCRLGTMTPTTARLRKSVPSSNATSRKHGRCAMCSCHRPRQRLPSGWVSVLLTRWRCTAPIYARSRPIWPEVPQDLSRSVYQRPTACPSACR